MGGDLIAIIVVVVIGIIIIFGRKYVNSTHVGSRVHPL
jgi:hypothetical protein